MLLQPNKKQRTTNGVIIHRILSEIVSRLTPYFQAHKQMQHTNADADAAVIIIIQPPS